MKTFKEITQAIIDKWKQTKTGLQEISIPLTEDVNGGVAQFVICKPTRSVLDAFTEYAKQENIDKCNSILFENCVLGGDMKFVSNGKDFDSQIYVSVLEELGKLMQPRHTKSRKL